jgi:hypothetical protein
LVKVEEKQLGAPARGAVLPLVKSWQIEQSAAIFPAFLWE